MICDFQDTGRRRAKDSLPIWECPRCESIVAAASPPARVLCRESPPLDPNAKFEGLPCEHRQNVRTVTVSLCGSCSREIETADCARFGKPCTVVGHAVGPRGARSATISCLDCLKKP